MAKNAADKNPSVIFTRPNEVVVEGRDVPAPKDDELLIRTVRSLISTGTELTHLSGESPPGSVWDKITDYPFVPGYCNVGEVVEVGGCVDREWIGRCVATYGGHAMYVTSGVAGARVIHRDIPHEQAAFFTMAEITMNGVRRGGVQWGESVAVYGLGILGQLAVRLCRIAGARPVFGIDTADSRLAFMPDDTSIVPVNPQKQDAVAVVERATGGRKADVVFEVTGIGTVIPEEFKVLRRQGRLVMLSSPRHVTQFDFHDLCNSPSFTIIGAHNLSHPQHETPYQQWTNHRHAELFFDLAADGELDVARLISHRIPYSEAPGAYQMLLQDRSQAMGVVLEWS